MHRREVVERIQQSFEIGERRACRIMKQPRSTQRYRARRPQQDKALIAEIRSIAYANPRLGYRSVTKLLRRESWKVNKKRVHRLWKQEGLKIHPSPAKKRG